MAAFGKSEERVALEEQIQSGEDYVRAHHALEELEAEEDYPAVRAYTERLDRIAEALPEENRKNAYYIHSGTDFCWARLFEFTVFEDLAFFENSAPDMLWDVDRYRVGSLVDTLKTLRNIGVLGKGNSLRMLPGNSDESTDHNHFNRPDYTLIDKGGVDIVSWLKKRHSGGRKTHYGAIIVASPVFDEENLVKGLGKFGYTLAHHEEGENIIAPYTLELGDVYVFLKED